VTCAEGADGSRDGIAGARACAFRRVTADDRQGDHAGAKSCGNPGLAGGADPARRLAVSRES
jgi:hypothetical protein